MNPEYTQNEDGSRSYTLTLTADQLASDQFLSNMKTGADLFKSWESQKSMIGKNTIPNADAGADAWASVYEKTRAANGYGLDNPDMEKLFFDNGLNKFQAAAIADYVKNLTAEDPKLHDDGELAKMFSGKFGDKAGETIARVNGVLNTMGEEWNKSFDSADNNFKLQMSEVILAMLDKFGVKPADFTVGKGGAPANPTHDRAGYEKEKREMIEKGSFTDLDDRALRQKYNVPFIDIRTAFGMN